MIESFTMSDDPEFTVKTRDVDGIYHNSPEAAIALCVDERAQVRALEHIMKPILTMAPQVLLP
jgi:hypothetical protein